MHNIEAAEQVCHGLVQVEVWESITAALATLGPTAFDEEEGNKEQGQEMDEEQLVEYEGMLVAASAAQRRR